MAAIDTLGLIEFKNKNSGEFMVLNEEYVLNHYGEEETNGTVDILRVGFTTNQLRFLERLCDMLIEGKRVAKTKKERE